MTAVGFCGLRVDRVGLSAAASRTFITMISRMIMIGGRTEVGAAVIEGAVDSRAASNRPSNMYAIVAMKSMACQAYRTHFRELGIVSAVDSRPALLRGGTKRRLSPEFLGVVQYDAEDPRSGSPDTDT